MELLLFICRLVVAAIAVGIALFLLESVIALVILLVGAFLKRH